jgi:hypothetical protein
VIYYGTQFVLRSTDRGANWTAISPDLTRNDPEKQGRNGGPLTPENVGAEFYNTIFYIAPNRRTKPAPSGSAATMAWCTSPATAAKLGKRLAAAPGQVIRRGLHQRHRDQPARPGDRLPGGTGPQAERLQPLHLQEQRLRQRWKRIDKGLPADTFVRVVREDPAQQGLLYAGTEAGMFVSYNDGGDGSRCS